MMPEWLQLFLTIVGSVIASTGFWTWLSKRMDKNDSKTKLLVGIAHDRILQLCDEYTSRGYITADEYENLNDYLYKPHEALGGDGAAKRRMKDVENLPIRASK